MNSEKSSTKSGNVTDEASMINGVKRIIQEQGRIDVLFNNAGYGSFGAIEDVPMEEARRQFEVNLFGLSRLTQLVLPYMRQQKSGKIINNSSVGGKIYTLLGAWYHATKHAVEGFSDCLRLEVKPFGIDVVVIQPGAITTEWDGIAREHVKKNSGNTAYRKMADVFVKFMENAGENASSPDVIARVVLKAIQSKTPKIRYVAGKYSKTMLFMRKILSDHMFDRALYRMFKV
ncbi:oxidoreductase [Paenibacillus sp. P96]|uniref:Oxidoreductase n=1 Tax=Paenibacillus zeirhizosphaerae TaxID=2987519 RepID=A0ABT9FS80_9BACL|nr:oxidoreductase [Paenibacillus sp. P96]MDP4097391.1 oxidoreductase [Paenibacillus sp. P96]